MYTKCKKVDISHEIFESFSRKNVAHWNAMIIGHTQNGFVNEAMELFIHMQLEGMKPNLITISGALQACTCIDVLLKGKEIHNYVIKSGLDSNDVIKSGLVMYEKYGRIEIAQ